MTLLEVGVKLDQPQKAHEDYSPTCVDLSGNTEQCNIVCQFLPYL